MGFANSVIFDLTITESLKNDNSFKKLFGMDLSEWFSQKLLLFSMFLKSPIKFSKFLAIKKPVEVTTNCLLDNLVINLQSLNSFNPREMLPDFLLNSDSNSLIDFEDSYKLNNSFSLISEAVKNFNILKSSKSLCLSKYSDLIIMPPQDKLYLLEKCNLHTISDTHQTVSNPI